MYLASERRNLFRKMASLRATFFSLQCYTQHVHVHVYMYYYIALKHVILLHVYYPNRHVHVSHVCCVSVYSFGHNSCVFFDFQIFSEDSPALGVSDNEKITISEVKYSDPFLPCPPTDDFGTLTQKVCEVW